MTISEILSSLKNVNGSGDQYTALCPAHDDKQNSLSIGMGDKGIVLHCHAGCSTENIIQAMGLTINDLFYEQRNPSMNSSGKREIEAVYDYTDINGKVVHSSIRYRNPKGFSQRRPDPIKPGQWIYNLKDIQPVIYNLPSVAKAIKEEKPIFIVEGEKDADNLIKLGFTATTNPMGAGKWREHYSDYLLGAICYIIADNDKPGNEHAVNVAKLLKGKAKTVKMIDLKREFPELPEKGDVSDFFTIAGGKDLHGCLELFKKMVNDAAEFSEKGNDSTKKSGLVCISDITPQDVEWLWKPYIPLGKISLMRGDPGQGKTTVSLTLASIVSNGCAFPTESGFTATEAGNVLYITAEDGLADTIAPRLIKAKANISRVFSYEESTIEQLSFMNPKFEELIKEAKPRLVIVDPIQAYLGSTVDGHRANEVRPVMHHIGTLAEKYNCAIVLIEHMNKGVGVKGLYRGLGSIDITAAARSILLVGSNPEDENDKGIAHIKSNLARHGKVIGFSISDERGLEWNPNTTLTSDILQGYGGGSGERTDHALEDAKDFLKDILTEGKQNSNDIYLTAKQYGISKRTLQRARDELDIDCKERQGFGKNTVVYWKLPCHLRLIKPSSPVESIIDVTDDEDSEILNSFKQTALSESQNTTDT